MKLDFAAIQYKDRPTLVLRNLDGAAIQTLGYAFNIEADFSYNNVSTITFDLPKYVDGKQTPHYGEVSGMRIIDWVGVGQFMLLNPSESGDAIRTVKSCKAYSLEYEFAKKDIFLDAGTYNFFDGIDTGNRDTVIGRILEKMPDWRANIDVSLVGKYRTFEQTSKKIYDFIKSDLQQAYGCIFDFDTYSRTVYIIPASAQVPTKQLYLSNENLIKKIDIEEDSDSIVTCLDVNGAEGVDIRSANPTGTNVIYNLDYFMNTTNFTEEFIEKWRRWENACNNMQDSYYDTTMSYNMKLLQLAMQQRVVDDLWNDRDILENERATIIAGIAQGVSSQAALNDVNARIAQKEEDIDTQSSSLTSIAQEARVLHADLVGINETLDWAEFFTDEEISVLRRYCIEDSIQDPTFVMQTAKTYIDQGLNTDINSGRIEVKNAEWAVTIKDNVYTWSVSGGTIKVASMNANVIKGTFKAQPNNSFIFTAYLGTGNVGSSAFNTANLTIYGKFGERLYEPATFIFTDVNGKFYFTEDSTEYQRHYVERELYEHGKQVLKEHASPTYTFSVESANFLSLDEYEAFHNQLALGQKLYLRIDNEVLQPYVTNVHVKCEHPESLVIDFSSSYSAFDHSFSLVKLLEQSVAMGKTMSYKSSSYGAFVNSGASTEVKKFMDSALDVAKNAVISSGNQAITFDDTGIRLRKWADEEHTRYAPEEIWMVDNMIAFTDDNWDTAKIGIGKVIDPNLSSSSNPTGEAYGVVAPYIVGTMMVGENVVIHSTRPDGEHMSFKVDGTGASLYNAAFTISDNQRQIILDPELGFGIGHGEIITTDAGGNRTWNTDGTHAKFWVDPNGNVHINGTLEGCDGVFSGELRAASGTFSGELQAASGTFSGELQAATGTFSGELEASAIKINGQNILDTNDRISANFLDLGNIFLDGSTGDITLGGNIFISGNIQWGSGNSPTQVLYSDVVFVAPNHPASYYPESSGTQPDGSFYNGHHRVLSDDDYYVYYSYDGGATWTDAIQLRGKDGQDGQDGSYSELSRGDIAKALFLKSTDVGSDGIYSYREGNRYVLAVNASYISTGIIDADLIQTGTLNADYLELSNSWGAFKVGYGDEEGVQTIGALVCGPDDEYYLLASNRGVRMSSPNESLYVSTNTIGATSNITITSDRRAKHDISEDLGRYEGFFMSLSPSSFKMNNGTSDRYHMGFVAQEVETALTDNGLSTKDFAGLVIRDLPESPDRDYCDEYSLRYSEFISLNTYMIQKLVKKVDELEKRIPN